jgi:hypothetical protein
LKQAKAEYANAIVTRRFFSSNRRNLTPCSSDSCVAMSLSTDGMSPTSGSVTTKTDISPDRLRLWPLTLPIFEPAVPPKFET